MMPYARRRVFVVFALCCAIAAIIIPSVRAVARTDGFQEAWQRAQRAGQYEFSATIVQTTTPRAKPSNIGRTSRTDTMRIDGQTNLADEQTHLTLWSNEETTPTQRVIEVQIDKGVAQGRQGEGAWQAIDGFDNVIAPQGDVMAYLHAAKDVVPQPPTTEGSATFRRYAFNVDGPGFASYMRTLIEKQIANKNNLRNGISVALPQQYASMTGTGEFWVGADGLPARQILKLTFPTDGESDVSAEVTVNFSNFGGAAAPGLSMFAAWLPEVEYTPEGISAVLLTFALAALVIVYRRSRPLYVGLTTVVVIAMIWSPLARGTQAAAAADRTTLLMEQAQQRQQVAAQQQTIKAIRNQGQATRMEGSTLGDDLGVEATSVEGARVAAGTKPALPPVAPHASVPRLITANPSGDDDNDGLTNGQEDVLGTNSTAKDADADGKADGRDTDGDTLLDGTEVKGFADTNAKIWYLDPAKDDTNDDGVPDTLECSTSGTGLVCPDIDSDTTPDAWDTDNDNDGVGDKLDISPNARAARTFTGTSPLSLTLSGLTPNMPTYVEFQLRPSNLDHLRYAFNVLDWPGTNFDGTPGGVVGPDTTGQIQDKDGKTFFDMCVTKPTPGAQCRIDVDGNGDMKLVPLLEIRTDGVADNLPSQSQLANYGISVRPLVANGSSKVVYVPLQLTTDTTTDNRLALYGKMLYKPGSNGWGNAQSVRLIWALQMLNDNVCVRSDQSGCKETADNQSQIVQTYDDSWTLAGLAVREDNGVQMATIYEAPAVDRKLDDDTALTALAWGLQNSFLAARDCDIVVNDACRGNGQRDITPGVIAQRFDHTRNGNVSEDLRWGISNTLRVDLRSYTHVDEAMITTAMTTTPTLLRSAFTSKWAASAPITPTLMFAREERYRASNLSLQGQSTKIAWSGSALTVNLNADGGTEVQVIDGLNWAPFQYNGAQWEQAPIETYWYALERRYASAQIPGVTQARADAIRTVAQLYYMSLYAGQTSLVQNGTVRFEDRTSIETDAEMRSLVGGYLKTARVQVVGIVNDIVLAKFADRTFLFDFIQELRGRLVNKSWQTVKDIGVDSRLGGSYTKLKNLFTGGPKFGGISLIGVLAVGLVGGILMATGYFTHNELIADIGSYIVTGVLVVITIAPPILALKAAYSAIVATGQVTAGSAIKQLLSGSSSVVGATRTAGAIGAVLTIGIVWGVFVYEVLSNKLQPGGIAFNTLLASAIAGTFVAIVLFVIGLTVIGTIIIAVLAVIDLVLLAICQAGVGALKVFGSCFTITGTVTDLLTKAIYGGDLLVDSNAPSPDIPNDPRRPLVSLGDLDSTLEPADQGFRAGVKMTLSAPVKVEVSHKIPNAFSWIWYYKDGKGSFFTADRLKSSSLVYSLRSTKETLSTSANAQRSDWKTNNVPWAIVQDEHISSSQYPLYRIWQDPKTVTSDAVTLQAGINKPLPMWLNVGYALTGYDCWVGYCEENSQTGSVNSDVSQALRFDVFPTTVDQFMALTASTSSTGPATTGYRQTWDPSFGWLRDADGDGLLSGFWDGPDPDDGKWDTDADGVSDQQEIDRDTDPRKTDTDRDGLADDRELQIATNPTKADTDGDGLTDKQEVDGYDFTYGKNGSTSLMTRVFSNPLTSDSDSDGMSDLTEKTLARSNPVAYPFSPSVFNDSPIALQARTNDADNIVRPGAALTYYAQVRNNLETATFADGSIVASFPPLLGATSPQTKTFSLFRGAVTTLQSTMRVPTNTASQVATIGNALRTDLRSSDGSTPRIVDAIKFSQAFLLRIDNDRPSAFFTGSGFVQSGGTRIIGGTASDPTSSIAYVDVSIDNGPWQRAESTPYGEGWAFAWDVPTVEGTHSVRARATDVAGWQQATPTLATIFVDGTAPTVTHGIAGNPIRSLERDARKRFTLALRGTASDPKPTGTASGLAAVEVQASPNGTGWQRAVLNKATGAWSIAYPLNTLDAANNTLLDPTGQYSFQVRAIDGTDNITLPANYATGRVRIDNTPPSVSLSGLNTVRTITSTMSITGAVSDTGTVTSGVKQVEIAYVPRGLTQALADPVALYGLDDGAGAVLFEEGSGSEATGLCRPGECPTTNAPGRFGTSARFNGTNQYVDVGTLNVPEGPITGEAGSGYSTSLWFDTTVGTGGLYGVVAGPKGDRGSDREVYLSNGNVCSTARSGAQLETICSTGVNFADGDWHHVVQTLGTGGHQLWVDGQPVAHGLVTASTLSTQTGITLGYADNAPRQFFNGWLDEVQILPQELSEAQVEGLFQSWQPTTLGTTRKTWQATIPQGLEGEYEIDLTASDGVNNRNDLRTTWSKWRGTIDTRAPTVAISVTHIGTGTTAQTRYEGFATDLNIVVKGFKFPCSFDSSTAYVRDAQGKLVAIRPVCTVSGTQTRPVSITACDRGGLCATAVPATKKIYWVTTDRRTIKRANAVDGSNIETLYTHTEQFGYNAIAMDTANFALLMSDNRSIWRIDLDGRNPRVILPNVGAFSALAVNSAAGKLYWINMDRKQLWRANLDGSNPEALFAVSGAWSRSQLGIDAAAGKVYWEERTASGSTITAHRFNRANFDGSDQETLFDMRKEGVQHEPNGLAVDPVEHTMYWADSGSFTSQTDNTGRGIWRLEAGKAPVKINLTDGRHPFGLTLDAATRRLYWAEGEFWTPRVGDAIKTMPLTGNTAAILVNDRASWIAVGDIPAGPTGVRTDLTLTQNAFRPGGGPFQAGETFRYVFVVTNKGVIDASNVTLIDSLPEGLSFVSSGAPGLCSAPNNVFTCNLGTMARGDSTTILLDVRVDANVSGPIVNTARIQSTEPDNNPADNTATTTVNVTAATPTPTKTSVPTNTPTATSTKTPSPTATPAGKAKRLVWADGGANALGSIQVEGYDLRSINDTNAVSGVAMDDTTNTMYWSQNAATSGGNTLYRATRDGAGRQAILSNLSNPRKIVLHDNRIYWVQSDGIWSVNVDGSDKGQVQSNIGGTIRTFGIDVPGGRIYYVDELGRFHRMFIDQRTSDEVLPIPASTNVTDLQVDSYRGQLYWTEYDGIGQATVQNGRLRRATVDGASTTTLASAAGEQYSLALDASAGIVYWTKGIEIWRWRIATSAASKVVALPSTSPYKYALILSYATPAATPTATASKTPTPSKTPTATATRTRVPTPSATMTPTGTAVVPLARKVFWVEQDTVYRANTDGSQKVKVATTLNNPTSVDLNTSNNMLFWSDVDPATENGRIRAVAANASNATTTINVITGQINVEGLAVDSANQRLYWWQTSGADGSSTMMRSVLNGTFPVTPQPLITGRTTARVGGMTVDGVGRVYWSEGDRNESLRVIRRVAPPSSGLATSVETLITLPEGTEAGGVYVDTVNQYLYWTQIEQNDVFELTGSVWRAKLTTSSATPITGIEQVVAELTTPEDLTVDAAGGRLYWTDSHYTSENFNDGTLESADLINFDKAPRLSGLSGPQGIVHGVMPAGSP